MDTGIAERSVNELDRMAASAWVNTPHLRPRPPAEPPAAMAPLPAGSSPLARALAALAPFGNDARRRERFQAAREQGCCHQCHAPLQNLLNDCPCPHWFTTSASTVERIAPVLRMYALADVLHFLLLHLEADNAGRAPSRSQLAVLAGDDGHELKVRLGRKQWSFRAGYGDDEGGLLTVGLFNPRTGKHCAIELPATPVDLDVMEALAHAIGDQ